jgi:hypothetical protein
MSSCATLCPDFHSLNPNGYCYFVARPPDSIALWTAAA